jgi:hypothetical protein
LLPFLKRKDGIATSTVLVKHREPDEQNEQDKDDPSAAHEACAKALLTAINASDIRGIAEALKDAFTLMDSEPHEEGEHTEPHSYDAQNEE